MSQSNIYEIIPLDTLFFRGSTPMEAGQYNAVSVFPPPVSVIKGAFWSAHCLHENKPFDEGLKEGGIIPFDVTGIFIKKSFAEKDYKIYIPAPATWYYDSEKKAERGTDLKDKTLCIAEEEPLLKNFSACSSAGKVVFVEPKKDAKPLAGAWVSSDFIKEPKSCFGDRDVLLSNDIYCLENRTGVALTTDKKALDGQLYTSSHLRFRDGISIFVKFDDAPDFNFDKLFLGGERRVALCKKFYRDIKFPKNDAENWLSLVPVEATEENLNHLKASAKIFVTAGWDMKKQFHKPSVSWIPAGAVFDKEINENTKKVCIPLIDKN